MSNTSKYKKVKDVNKSVVAKTSHNEHKDVLLKIIFKTLMNRIKKKS